MEPTDEHGTIPCPSIYTAEWIESFTGDVGSIRFVSHENFGMKAKVLVYLAHEALPRNMLSTNSRSEAQHHKLQKRLKACDSGENLPRTLRSTSSQFTNDEYLADVYKNGVWLEWKGMFRGEFKEITIHPENYNIDGEVITRFRLIDEFFDEAKHGFIRSAGKLNLIIYRAVDWKEYRERLVELTTN